LIGVTGERDATGTRLELAASERHWRRQLTAGDGFAACNERLVTIGLGNATQVDQLVVSWRGGRTETFSNLPVNVRLTIVEGGPITTQ
jgi:hypothetical protein